MTEGPTSTRFIRTLIRRGFDSVATLGVTATPEILEVVASMPEKAQFAILEIDVTFGVHDTPITETVRFYIAVVDRASIPGERSLTRTAEWVAAQRWRSTTAIGIYQTFSQALLDMLNPIIHSTIEVSERSQDLVLATIISASTTSEMAMVGKLVYEAALMQRRWAGDTSWDDYKGLTEEEVLTPVWIPDF